MKDWKQITKESYEVNAQSFAFHTVGYRGKLKLWTEFFTDSLQIGSKILDVGCGAGRDAFYFSEHRFNVTGIDFSKELIKIAQKKVPKGKFRVMDFEEMDFPSDSFDGIWASASLYHLPKKHLPPVLARLHEILKPGGLLFILVRMGKDEKFTFEKRADVILKRFASYFQPEEIEKYLTQAEFRNIKSELDLIDSGEWIGLFARK